MTEPRLGRPCSLALVAVLAGLAAGWVAELRAADAPRVRDLRTQRVGDTTFFHVHFEPPADMESVPVGPDTHTLTRQPRLVPQDGKTQAVYHRVEGLEFVGTLHGEGRAKLLLLYPVSKDRLPKAGKAEMTQAYQKIKADLDSKTSYYDLAVEERGKAVVGSPAYKRHDTQVRQLKKELDDLKEKLNKAQDKLDVIGPPPPWAETPVELDFARAKKVAVPVEAARRKPDQPPAADDLRGLWASGQAACFALLEALSPDFGFYGFAREATGRKYRVPAPALPRPPGAAGRPALDSQLYEMTTGATAIADSLQLKRMLNPNTRDKGERTVDVTKIPGIDIAEHPWKKMMGGKKPSADPLARLVPHDNYYVRFKNVRKFLEFGDLLDLWGTTIARACEINSRDYGIRGRYQKQLCLRSTGLARTLGPAVVRGLAISGSDAFLREGSDVTVLFHVVNKQVFLAAVEPFVQQARKEFGRRLKEGRADHHGTLVESFVTPLREVSLHRAAVGAYVIYSNSPAGVRRVLDANQGRLKALADSLDYQYLRTVFRFEDEAEDAFAFLSDPFIRRQVGPAVKIKEKRRLEALTSLYMLSHGALFTAWETGKLPTEQKKLLAASTLKLEELYAPEGKGVTWDPERQVAVSEAYNTLDFATPLIELPIDKVTPLEEQGYNQFRAEYLGLWRQYFDPVGMRLALTDKRVTLDTYILPLVQNSMYRELRRWTGGGTVKLDPSRIAPKTLFQFQTHIATDLRERNEVWEFLSILGGKVRPFDFLGDWFLVRLDGGEAVDRLAGMVLRMALKDEKLEIDEKEATRTFFQIPLTLGVSIRNPLIFAPALAVIRAAIASTLPGAVTWGPVAPYKGVSMVRVRATPNGEVNKFFNDLKKLGKDPFTPQVFYALIDGGWYLSVSDAALRDIIDKTEARNQSKKEPARNGPAVDINSSLYLAPGAASAKLRQLMRFYLETASHQQAMANLSAWYAFYRGGVIDGNASPEVMAAAARRYLGYVLVSPEGSAYAHAAKTDEVVNRRHGSLRRPTRHRGVEDTAPLGLLLEQIRSVRADLRFREDGIHTTLTIERKPAAK